MNKRFDKIDLYPVIGGLEVLRAVIAGGVEIVQLREKEISKNEFYHLAVKFREITRQRNVLLIINDQIDIALAVEADGVHLGRDDLPIPAARKIAPNLIIGASTHNLEEAMAAEREGASYINIGPIFETKTKPMAPVGIEAIKTIAPKINIPFTVMGGIKLGNLAAVLKAGARKIAVVSALTRAEKIEETTRDFIHLIRSHSGN